MKNQKVFYDDFFICKSDITKIGIKVSTENQSSDYKLIINGIEYNYEIQSINKTEKLFFLEIDNIINISQIELFIVRDNKFVLLFKYNNNLIWKILNRTKNIIIKLKTKSLNVIKLIIKGFLIIWKKHKLIIPINMWTQYYKSIKLRLINDGNSPFFHIWNIDEYNNWLSAELHDKSDLDFQYNPKISIIVPVYNVESSILIKCIESVLTQTYKNIELCLVDDASINEQTIEVLKYYEVDNRVKVKYRNQNGHICETSNDALHLATGEFIGLLDNDDLLNENACAEIVKALNIDIDIDFIYTDEDKIDELGNFCEPHFKPDYSPDTLCSLNYISHFAVIRKSIVQKVGGFVIGTEGAQDYDLYLRIIEVTEKIHHIPKILYHWRKMSGSTSTTIQNKHYAIDAGKIAIKNHFLRLGEDVNVNIDQESCYYYVDYLLDIEPSVSIIIPTKDNHVLLNDCLSSIYQLTSYKNFEVLIISNNSVEIETFNLFKEYSMNYKNFRVLYDESEFNYSKLNNLGAITCISDFLLFLNNDTKIIQSDWLNCLVGYASQKHIGAVGAKLLYEDETIQHCGVVLGVGGVASHAFLNEQRSFNGMFGRLSVPYNYSAVTGACMMVSKYKFDQICGFDENLRIAYNDVDLCIKLIKNGCYNIVLPQIVLYHYESKTRGYDTTIEKYNLFLKESNYIKEKWNNLIINDPFYNMNFSRITCFLLDKKKFNFEKWISIKM